MKKKLNILLITALMGTILLTGCGSKTSSNTEATTKNTASTTDNSTSAANTSTTAAADTTKAATSSTAAADSSNKTAATSAANDTGKSAASNTTAATQTADTQTAGTTDNSKVLKCPYCDLEYSGDDTTAYYAHIAACASANGGRSSLATCPYCNESFSTVVDDPKNPGVSLYDSHIQKEEAARR